MSETLLKTISDRWGIPVAAIAQEADTLTIKCNDDSDLIRLSNQWQDATDLLFEFGICFLHLIVPFSKERRLPLDPAIWRNWIRQSAEWN